MNPSPVRRPLFRRPRHPSYHLSLSNCGKLHDKNVTWLPAFASGRSVASCQRSIVQGSAHDIPRSRAHYSANYSPSLGLRRSCNVAAAPPFCFLSPLSVCLSFPLSHSAFGFARRSFCSLWSIFVVIGLRVSRRERHISYPLPTFGRLEKCTTDLPICS